MADVRVTPDEFTMVRFEAARIRELTSEIADKIGLDADTVVEIDVDESTPAARARVESIDPIRIHVKGGALEDSTAPRDLSERMVGDVIGRLLLRAADRRSGAFADAPPDDELDLAHQTAWDSYALGRLDRLGYDVRRPRRLYHFRNRHGFTDVADQAFERCWTGSDLTWAEVDAMCQETAAARVSA